MRAGAQLFLSQQLFYSAIFKDMFINRSLAYGKYSRIRLKKLLLKSVIVIPNFSKNK